MLMQRLPKSEAISDEMKSSKVCDSTECPQLVVVRQETKSDANLPLQETKTEKKEASLNAKFLELVQAHFNTDMDRDVFNRLPLSNSQKVEILMGLPDAPALHKLAATSISV